MENTYQYIYKYSVPHDGLRLRSHRRWSSAETPLGSPLPPLPVLYRVRMPECWPLHRTRLPTSVSVAITPQLDSYQHLVSETQLTTCPDQVRTGCIYNHLNSSLAPPHPPLLALPPCTNARHAGSYMCTTANLDSAHQPNSRYP